MAKNKGMRVDKCPIGQDYCYPSCYYRRGNRCCFRSKRGRQISTLKEGKLNNDANVRAMVRSKQI